MLKKQIITFFLLIVITSCFSQNEFNLPNTESDKIRFKLIGNLIVLPVELNGVELSFILDSGVSKPILFNIANTDSLQIHQVETIYIRGLGGGDPIEALKSRNNFFKIGNALNINQEVFVVFNNDINFTPRLGVPIHGIIGYDIFKNFVVEINYTNKVIKLHKPETYVYKSCKKCETFNLSFHNKKPYIDAEVMIDSIDIPVKLLIDTGSSDGLWLFEDDSLGIQTSKNKYFDDFLGKGLSGSIYGKRTKVNSFSLKSFKLKDVNTAFPDSTSISFARKFKERNGSVSGEVLKRFNIIFDYRGSKLTLKKNGNFRAPFFYNKSGIVLEQNGIRVVKEKEDRGRIGYTDSNENKITINLSTSYKYSLKPAFTIVELRQDSPAARAGLMIGDVILTVNGKESHNLELQDVIQFFRAEVGKLIRLKVDRNAEIRIFSFRLEDVFK
ncbi:signaling protein [Flavobacteriales bacterium 34_180_T64]|nr:signaling protein [Flavobacteriales bacterium 34_180_T64]